jgi:hypothetical protein
VNLPDPNSREFHEYLLRALAERKQEPKETPKCSP